jgi:hypothetical protein
MDKKEETRPVNNIENQECIVSFKTKEETVSRIKNIFCCQMKFQLKSSVRFSSSHFYDDLYQGPL